MRDPALWEYTVCDITSPLSQCDGCGAPGFGLWFPEFGDRESVDSDFKLCLRCSFSEEALREQLFMRHGTGCCLHAAVDDNNTDLETLDACIQRADEANHAFCSFVGRVLRGKV